MNELLTTNVSEVAAVHLTMSLACNPAAKRDMTLIWHTGRTWCEPGDHSHGSIAWPDPPRVWEVSHGDFEPVDTVQCSHCGRRYGTLAKLYDGHLDDDEVMDRAVEVWDDVEDGRVAARRKIQDALARDLASWDEAEGPTSYDERVPGITYDAHGCPVAWTYDPWDESRLIEARPPVADK